MIQPEDLKPHQLQILKSEAPYTFVHGGIGTFKTSTCIMKLIAHCVKYPGQRLLVIAQTYGQLQKVIYEEWLNLVPHSWYKMRGKDEILIPDYDAKIWLQYAENPRAKDRIVGMNSTGYYITQIETFKSESLFEELNQRTRKQPPPGVEIDHYHLKLMDANPGSPLHFSYQMFVDKSGEDYIGSDRVDEIFVATTPETSVYTAEQIEEYRHTLSKTEYDRRITGKWTSLEGLVFENFNPAIHVQEYDVNKDWRCVLGIDWGYNNPLCVLFLGVNSDGILHIFDELYQSNLQVKHAAKEVAKRWVDLYYSGMGVDSAQPNDWRTFGDTMRELGRGIPVQLPKKDRKHNTALIMRRFDLLPDGRPKVLIHPRCENLIKELSALQWAQSVDGRPNKEVPEDINNHAVDAWGYAEKAYLERV